MTNDEAAGRRKSLSSSLFPVMTRYLSLRPVLSALNLTLVIFTFPLRTQGICSPARPGAPEYLQALEDSTVLRGAGRRDYGCRPASVIGAYAEHKMFEHVESCRGPCGNLRVRYFPSTRKLLFSPPRGSAYTKPWVRKQIWFSWSLRNTSTKTIDCVA